MPKSDEKLAFGPVQPDVALTAGPCLCLLYKLMTGHRLINLEAKRTHAAARSWHSRQRRCTVRVCVAAAVGSCSSRTSGLARYVAAVLLSVRMDVHRGAAALRTNSYSTTTSSTSTTSTTRVPPSLPLRRRREGIIYDYLHASDSVLRGIYFVLASSHRRT